MFLPEDQFLEIPCPYCKNTITYPMRGDNKNYKILYDKLKKDVDEFYEFFNKEMEGVRQIKHWDSVMEFFEKVQALKEAQKESGFKDE